MGFYITFINILFMFVVYSFKDNKMDIIHDKENCRFYVIVNQQEAFVKYTLTSDTMDVFSTYVPKELEGKGIASSLVKYAYEYADSLHLRPVGSCSYAA